MGRTGVLHGLWTCAILLGLALYTFSGHMDLSWATLFVVTISFVCELVDSSLGMGYGTTLTPLLLLFGVDPRVLVPTILLSELASGFSASAFHHGHGNVDFVRHALHRRTAIILSLCSIVGVVLGVQVALGVSRTFLTRLIGVIVLGAGIFILAARGRFAYSTWKIMALGMGAAFNKAVSGGGYGPLLTSGQVLAGMGGKPAIAITSLAEAVTCLSGSILFFLRGQRVQEDLAVPVIAGALLSVPFSARIVRRIDEAWLKRAIAIFTIALGSLTLIRSLR